VAGAAAGGGLLLGFYLPQRVIAEAATAGTDVFGPNAFVRIRPDNSVTLIMPQVEMGQGTYTSMSMLIAEELEVDLAQVTLEAAPPDDKLYANPLTGFQVTGGSTSVMAYWEPLRRAGATARVMLIAAAANDWSVNPQSCRAEKGAVVVDPATGRRLKYGELADAAAKLPVPDKVALKDPKDFTLIGTPAKRIDTPDKVYYYLVPDDSLRGFRVCQGDLVLVVPAASPIDGAIMLVEVKGRRMLKKVKRLEGFQLLLQGYDREYSAETVAINEVTCLGRCVRAEISLS
jgi:isoquinoline 1-oxidoreductase beta subunit